MPYYRGEVVSDGALQALYSAYRNCNKYADGGDSIIRDRLESAGVPINGTDQACSLGSRDEEAVRANLDANMGESQAKIAVQAAAIPSGYQSGVAPATPLPADVVFTATPQGQTTLLAGSPMQSPTTSTSGPAGAFGYSTPGGGVVTSFGASPTTITAPSSGGFPWMLILLVVAGGAGIYFLTKG